MLRREDKQMATLSSPGVEVTISDESAYAAPGTGTIPLFLVATGQDKADPTSSTSGAVAAKTTAATAGTPVLVGSQRELTQNFGDVFFRQSGGNVVVGDETSEYGLLAAYSFLGQGGSAYIQRADVNTTQLIPTTTTPTSAYATANSIWLDTNASSYGINQYNSTTSAWETKTPTVEVNLDATASEAAGDSYSPSATVVNGSFLVVVHGDQDGAMSLEYFIGLSGSWEQLDSDGNLSNGDTVTWDEHYSEPSTPGNGDVWIKTTSPGGGIDLKLYRHSGSGSWTLGTVQGVSTTMADGAAAIGDFVPQDGSSTTALTTTTAVAGNFLIDLQANTKAVAVIVEVESTGNPGDLSDETAKLAQNDEPTGTAATGTKWFDGTLTGLDMYQVNSGYAPVVPTYSTSAPSSPSAGDIWVDTTSCGYGLANERDYPKIYKRNAGNSAWVLHSNSDQTTSNGVLFADITDTAADNSNGGKATTITGAPDAAVYPAGMIVINMAQSKNTVRNYNGTAWRNAAGNHADGSGKFGRFAQRGVIAAGLQAACAADDLRDMSRNFTLIAAPGYPELADEMATLNTDRGETSFVIVDSPLRKTVSEAVTWANGSGTTENGEDGLVTKHTYSATYYPAVQATDPTSGKTVVTYPSHAVMYQMAYNDSVSYNWFAPAGLSRGLVTNASGVGYVTGENEFKGIALTTGNRDSLYTAKVNPIASFPGSGIVLFGQKSLHGATSALDRINVGRLVAYCRERFEVLARPLLFEQNDAITRARAYNNLYKLLG